MGCISLGQIILQSLSVILEDALIRILASEEIRLEEKGFQSIEP